MRRVLLILLISAVLTVAYVTLRGDGAARAENDAAIREVTGLVVSVRNASFPRLKGVTITVHEMSSDSVYMESRFTFTSFLFRRTLQYLMLFNPAALARQVPPDGLRAIVAHELAHVDYFENHSRMGLLALVQLLSARFSARFERSADLEAIELGYGPGLASYRIWLYRNVPASRMEEKKRDYFSPVEIEAILRSVRENPSILQTFSRCVPRDLEEIEREAKNPNGTCPD